MAEKVEQKALMPADVDALLKDALDGVVIEEGANPFRSMANREAHGIYFELHQSDDGRSKIVINDSSAGEVREVWIKAGDNPMEAFYHPYAYQEYRYRGIGGSALEAA